MLHVTDILLYHPEQMRCCEMRFSSKAKKIDENSSHAPSLKLVEKIKVKDRSNNAEYKIRK